MHERYQEKLAASMDAMLDDAESTRCVCFDTTRYELCPEVECRDMTYDEYVEKVLACLHFDGVFPTVTLR